MWFCPCKLVYTLAVGAGCRHNRKRPIVAYADTHTYVFNAPRRIFVAGVRRGRLACCDLRSQLRAQGSVVILLFLFLHGEGGGLYLSLSNFEASYFAKQERASFSATACSAADIYGVSTALTSMICCRRRCDWTLEARNASIVRVITWGGEEKTENVLCLRWTWRMMPEVHLHSTYLGDRRIVRLNIETSRGNGREGKRDGVGGDICMRGGRERFGYDQVREVVVVFEGEGVSGKEMLRVRFCWCRRNEVFDKESPSWLAISARQDRCTARMAAC